MNKLEKAISLSFNTDNFSQDMFVHEDPSKSMEEISKMEVTRELTNDELDELKLVYPGCSQEKLVNQLRDIRTEINKHANKNLIMITSIQEKSGVSFFSSNIAAVTAFDAARSSLLIDCHISSERDSKFDLNKKDGLIDYIYNSDLNEKDIISETGLNRYRVIHSGQSKNRSREHFVHPRFRKLLFSLKNRYNDRTIYLDAPPLTSSADARILADLCDLVIIILPNGKVQKSKLEAAAKQIPKEKLLGVVVNNYIY